MSGRVVEGSAPVRIVILGNSGSGKTTMARELERSLGLRRLDLDLVAWSAPGVRKPIGESAAAIRAFAGADDRWVIEGSYGSLVKVALAQATELRFLNPGVEACIANCRRRSFEPEKFASPEEQDQMLGSLIDWVSSYPTREDEYGERFHRAVFERFPGPKREYGKAD